MRTLGTEEWTRLPYHSILDDGHLRNVLRPTFKPGMMSVIQQNENAAIIGNYLVRPLYLWKSTFSFSELYNVRVKEYGIYQDLSQGSFINRIELLAVCKAPPAGQLLETSAGCKGEMIYNNCVETSEPVPSKWTKAIAEFSDRWKNGHQEIRLTFSRSRQLFELGKAPPQCQERIAGTMYWIWDAFLAFLCGNEWSAPTWKDLDFAVQLSLQQVVASPSGNPFAEFEEMDDDWILIKP